MRGGVEWLVIASRMVHCSAYVLGGTDTFCKHAFILQGTAGGSGLTKGGRLEGAKCYAIARQLPVSAKFKDAKPSPSTPKPTTPSEVPNADS